MIGPFKELTQNVIFWERGHAKYEMLLDLRFKHIVKGEGGF
jgi:hypothetical protein